MVKKPLGLTHDALLYHNLYEVSKNKSVIDGQ